MKKEIKFYNVIFPVWMMMILPIVWIVVLPANFIVDSCVLLIALKFIIKQKDIKLLYKKTILKVWILGFVADIIGAVTLLAAELFFSNRDSKLIKQLSSVYWNAFDNIYAFLYVACAVLISAVLIFVLNYKYSFSNITLEKEEKVRAALTLAILTAPYTFFIPTEMIYR
ncbi:hypothetical protein [Aminipila sp.]|uniref:hypothetical protein n=1 Tax=Aminipila sp. TaxID=2060095 RepID=UPI0028997EB3|nr:hypothetical protein [Aminipila sp.]